MEVSGTRQQKELVEKVAASQILLSAPKLRALFLYVADCSLRGKLEELTEQKIGIHVFSRPQGYNPGDDSIVRSQARLLRMKLTTYFLEEGKLEPLVIEIPKGHYVPVFRDREAEPIDAPEQTAPAAVLAVPSDPPQGSPVADAVSVPRAGLSQAVRSVKQLQTPVLLLFALVLAFAAGGWSYRHWSTTEARTPDVLWSLFFAKTPQTLVIYSNPLFEGTPATGLKVVTPGSGAASQDLDETYTGTGEVAAIREITHFFDAHDADFTLKRSRLVTWDEARSSNLIFVGAPSQNPALQESAALKQFGIVVDAQDHGSIVNLHPLPGEPTSFPTNDKTQDTAIVALVPGFEARTHILVASGLTTIGTQTAVEFLCRSENILALAQKAGTAYGEIRPFEAILQIHISKGVGVNASLVMLHRH